jgi:hypothetical protein
MLKYQKTRTSDHSAYLCVFNFLRIDSDYFIKHSKRTSVYKCCGSGLYARSETNYYVFQAKVKIESVISYRRWKRVERHLCSNRKCDRRMRWPDGRTGHVGVSLWGCPYAALQTCLCGEASRFPLGTGALTSPQVARRWTCRAEIRADKNNMAQNLVYIYVNRL